MMVLLLQERWEDPEEDYYKPEKKAIVKHSGQDDDLEIDAGDVSGGKLKRMHPFGQGIRYVPCFIGCSGPLASIDNGRHAGRPGQLFVTLNGSRIAMQSCRSANCCRHCVL